MSVADEQALIAEDFQEAFADEREITIKPHQPKGAIDPTTRKRTNTDAAPAIKVEAICHEPDVMRTEGGKEITKRMWEIRRRDLPQSSRLTAGAEIEHHDGVSYRVTTVRQVLGGEMIEIVGVAS